ncbi:LOW QUALITY PROTEIN: uncharacterized protein LOC129793054 [Lutzomyia longipalpis]|uniref:LOW QUALITY PROTEIN: uncharacterized protein LOC129793054 n=1 Tax=Lutzomyia longipalpis TaxID=7200 RepID=UPI0024846DA5|nr:LOW QUALITY PROTEIN: uncharacterized protein LOC129793054 [Lutzomyia longipalpis]
MSSVEEDNILEKEIALLSEKHSEELSLSHLQLVVATKTIEELREKLGKCMNAQRKEEKTRSIHGELHFPVGRIHCFLRMGNYAGNAGAGAPPDLMMSAEKLAPFIRRCLKSAVESGALVQTKGKGASGSCKLAITAKAEEKTTKQKPRAPKRAATSEKKAKKAPALLKKPTAAAKKAVTAKKPSDEKKTPLLHGKMLVKQRR